MEAEIYPMPSFPTFEVADMAVSTEWYQRVLGFQLVLQIPGANQTLILSHLRWAKFADLLLVPDRRSSSDSKGRGFTLSFSMGLQSIDEFTNRVSSEDAGCVKGLVNQPWNARELMVRDPDGFLLVFTQPIDTGKSFSDVLDDIQSSSS